MNYLIVIIVILDIIQFIMLIFLIWQCDGIEHRLMRNYRDILREFRAKS